MAMSSSTASPEYSASFQQVSPYVYAASSYVPSPLGSGLAYTPSPPPQQLQYAYFLAQRQQPPSPPTALLHHELGIAPGRADEIFIARQYEATERCIARAVPDGVARAGRGMHNQEEYTGATVYTGAGKHLIDMRQALSALSGVPMTTVPIVAVSEPSALIAAVNDMLATTSYPLSDPPQAPKDTILVLAKIEEAREPSAEEAEERSEDEFDIFATDKYGRILSTPDRGTTPELSSGSGSPASQGTFPSLPSDNGLGIETGPAPSEKLDNDGWEPNWKIPVPLGTLDWLTDSKRWEEETVNMLARIGIDEPAIL